MQRRGRTLIAIAIAAAGALCLGSVETALAVSKPAAVSANKSIKACATKGGALRLSKSSGKCANGTTKIKLARPSMAPQALAIYTTDTQSKKLPLHAGGTLTAACDNTNDPATGITGTLTIDPAGKTQIDGTSYLTNSGDAGTDFFYKSGGMNPTPTGASAVYSTVAGGFRANTVSGYSTLNAHLLVTVPGEEYTIDVILDVNGSGYCRISTEVESATT